MIDSLAGIRIVHNRATMLLPLREHGGLLLHPPHGYTPRKPHVGASGFHTARVTSPMQVRVQLCTLAVAVW